MTKWTSTGGWPDRQPSGAGEILDEERVKESELCEECDGTGVSDDGEICQYCGGTGCK
jgi:DnaJ-class molecular chaperone